MGGHLAYINGPLLRRRVAALGVSDRTIGRLTGLNYGTLRRAMNESHISSGTRLIDLVLLAKEVGLTLGQLLDPTPPESFPPDSAEPANAQELLDDGRLLVQMLYQAGIAIPADRIALLWGVPLWRVERAADSADRLLAFAGLKIHHAQTGLTIISTDKSMTDLVRDSLRLRDHDKGVSNHQLRHIYTAMTDGLNAHAARGPRAMHIAAALNRGYLEAGIGRTQKFEASAETAFALDITTDEIYEARKDVLR
jgi:hypothetical protein